MTDEERQRYAEIARLTSRLLSPEIIEIGARALCDRHVSPVSVWDCGFTDRGVFLRNMRSALEAIVAALPTRPVLDECAERIEALACHIRDHGPVTDEGVLTSIAGTHAGALLDAASLLRREVMPHSSTRRPRSRTD